MVMLMRGGAGSFARLAGRSKAAVDSGRSATVNMAPQTASAETAAAMTRLRLRRSLAGEAAPRLARPASSVACQAWCGPGRSPGAPALSEASGMPEEPTCGMRPWRGGEGGDPNCDDYMLMRMRI